MGCPGWSSGAYGKCKTRIERCCPMCYEFPIAHKPEARPKTSKIVRNGPGILGTLGSEALRGTVGASGGPSDQEYQEILAGAGRFLFFVDLRLVDDRERPPHVPSVRTSRRH